MAFNTKILTVKIAQNEYIIKKQPNNAPVSIINWICWPSIASEQRSMLSKTKLNFVNYFLLELEVYK